MSYSHYLPAEEYASGYVRGRAMSPTLPGFSERTANLLRSNYARTRDISMPPFHTADYVISKKHDVVRKSGNFYMTSKPESEYNTIANDYHRGNKVYSCLFILPTLSALYISLSMLPSLINVQKNTVDFLVFFFN